MHYSKDPRESDQPVDKPGKNAHAEEKYRCLFEQATDLIVIHDIHGAIVDVNESLCTRLGYSREELLNMNFRELIDPEQIRAAPLRMAELASGELIFSERRYMCKDGSFVEIEANVKKMSNNLIMGVCRDVSERRKMERELREAEFKFRTISEKSLVGIYIIQDGNFAYVNPKFAAICGYSRSEMSHGFPVERVVDERDREMVRENIRARMEGEIDSIHFEVRGRKKDGTLIYAEVFGSRGTYNGRTAIIGTLIDITERKKADEQIIKERNLSNDVIDCLPGVFFLQDRHGRYLRWNKQFETETGYSLKEISRLKPIDFFDGLQKPVVQAKIDEIFSDLGSESQLEMEIITKSGKRIPYYFKGKNIQYEGGPCLIGTGIDITELKRVEADLKKSEANLQTMFENTDTAYVLMDNSFRVVTYNQKAVDFIGQVLHHKIQAEDDFAGYFAPDRRTALLEWMNKVVKGKHIHYEIAYPREEGTLAWYFVRMFPTSNDGKEILGIMIAVSDITERKLTEQKLQRTVEQLTYHINNTPLAVIEWDKDLRVIQWSKRAEEIFGWGAAEALGRPMNDYIVYKDDVELVKRTVEDLWLGKSNQNLNQNRNYTKDNNILHCEWYNSLLRDENGNVQTILSLVRDVTEIRNAEEELRRSFKMISDYKIALDESSIVGITDPQGLFTYVNDNFCNISGFTKEELLGKDHRILNSGAHSGEFMNEKWNKISGGKIWRGEISNRTKQGSNFWVDETIIPFLDENGYPVQFMSISNDITQKKLMEKEILDQKVEEQKKITRAVIQAQEKERNKMGQELHDNVNQILASTRMFLSVALNSEEFRRDLVEGSTGMLDNAIQEIRLLSKNQITPQGKLGLRELIQLLTDSLNETSTLKTTFEYQASQESSEIETDLKLNVYRIIQEQLNNILKHAEASQVGILLQSDSSKIRISVCDDGKGFDPLQNRKGIGITNMINRVESFNGEFTIHSAPGKGCQLTICIPVS